MSFPPPAFLFQALEACGECITLLDREGHLLYMNSGGQRLMEIDNVAAQYTLIPWEQVWPSSDQPTIRAALTTALQGETARFQAFCPTAKGTPKWWEVLVTAVGNSTSPPDLLLGIWRDITAQKRAETALTEERRLAQVLREVSDTLVGQEALPAILSTCTEALVQHLEAAFARIWLLNREEAVLELCASAGQAPHLDGIHARIPVGQFAIGRIAQEQAPYLTNDVQHDPEVADLAWAVGEGIVAFAGYPLLVGETLMGVVALFALRPLSPQVVEALGAVANTLALGIAQKWVEAERQQLLELAQAARAEAEAALEVRNGFLASVSHDLKTPLSAMSLNVQLLQRRLAHGEVPAAQVAERLTLIQASTTKVTRMIEDLLDVAQLQSGQTLELARDPIPMGTLLTQVGNTQQTTTDRHQLVVRTPAEDVVVLGDAGRLERVLTNLLGNAIKYSPDGGQITAELALEAQEGLPWMVLRIQDEGVGIPEGDLPHIFDSFYRAGNVTGRMLGTGVGLASVVQILTQHGGTITVQSVEGHGSTFLIRLPTVPPS